MKLKELICDLPVNRIIGETDVNVDYLSCQADNVRNNTMFFCINGTKVDGHIFAKKVMLEGVKVVVVERVLDLKGSVTQLVVSNSRIFMALCAKNFFKCACDKLKIIGVTGTNGKTSTTYILKSILEESGYTVGVIGTNGVWIDNKRYATSLTTPDPIELHEWFLKMSLSDVDYVVMEVSAHALALGKIEGIRFDIGVFTNFGRDHLDFFKTISEYEKTKRNFFNKKFCKVAVVNADDVVGRKIIKESRIPVVTYGLDSPADIFAIDVKVNNEGIGYTINLCDDVMRVKYKLKGKFNVYNTICASSAARILGINSEKIAQGIMRVNGIEGRAETYELKNGGRVVVDFAHTPEGFANILSYLKTTLTDNGKMICVFGCGGDRDKFKRPLMSKEVSKYCDFAIITNDNPRYENPKRIIADILEGISIEHDVVEDRYGAILQAVNMTKESDTLVILGKGAENYQEMNGRYYPFNDVEVLKKYLKQ